MNRSRLVAQLRNLGVEALAVAELAREPLLFLHPRDTGCADCDEAWLSL